MYLDSMSRPIDIGYIVRFRSRLYEIQEFHPGEGRWGSAAITFTQKPHLDERPDECSVDFVARSSEELPA